MIKEVFSCEISSSRLFSFLNFKVFNILFKDRVTKPQKKMLITLLRETKYMEGKKEKEWYWEKIQAALNTIGPKKTIIQWKKVSSCDYIRNDNTFYMHNLC